LPDDRGTTASDNRKIIHVDMDAFFAAIEQRDNPDLQGKPVVVGGDPSGRGVVATCSYEARRFGIHSAMAASRAKALCPQAVFLRPRMDAYRKTSQHVMSILRSYTPLVEPLSLDEAFLDVTAATEDGTLAVQIAQEIRARIQRETGLTASAGVSYNKIIAKLASDWHKPNGIMVVPPSRGLTFLAPLHVSKLHGIGPSTVDKLAHLGISTVMDLRNAPSITLVEHFGKLGIWFHQIANGIDLRQVQPDRERKSVGSERTFPTNLTDMQDMVNIVGELVEQVSSHLSRSGLAGRTISLKARFPDFTTVTRSLTVLEPIWRREDIMAVVTVLLPKAVPTDKGVPASIRLLGVSVSTLVDTTMHRSSLTQLNLFSEARSEEPTSPPPEPNRGEGTTTTTPDS